MTNSNDRLDRVEALLERSISASNERLSRIEHLVESNSRSIQALNDDLVELRLTVAEDHQQAAEERAELRQATIGIANLLGSLDSDRPIILRKLNTIENKVDRLLERDNGGRPQA
jgi:predicted  nucleic acid-binding Zn-ribbon protein